MLRRCFPFTFLTVALMALLLLRADARTFKNPTIIDTSYDPVGTAAADFNHDTNLDLIYVDGSSPSTLHVLLGRGNGTFSHAQDVALPQNMCGFLSCVINLADVTHDGDLDVIVGGGGSGVAQIAVLTGNGDGTFAQPIISVLANSSGNFTSLNGAMGVGDLNGDGEMDLVIPDPMTSKLYVAQGDNTGHFTLRTALNIFFTGQVIAYVVDLNGDGKMDVVAVDRIGATTGSRAGEESQCSADCRRSRLFLWSHLNADLLGDGTCYLLLQCQGISHIALIAPCPQMLVGGSTDQLCSDSNLFARAQHCAFHHGVDA